MKQNREESLQPSMVTSDLHWEMVPGHHRWLKVSVSRSRPRIPQVTTWGREPGPGQQEERLSCRWELLQDGRLRRGLLELQSRRVMLVAGLGGWGGEAENRSPRGIPGYAKRYWKKRKISEHVFLAEPLVCGMKFCYDSKMLSHLCKLFIGCLLCASSAWHRGFTGVCDRATSPAFLE